MPQPLVSHSPVVDRLDLGAGMCDALGLSDVSVQAMHHTQQGATSPWVK